MKSAVFGWIMLCCVFPQGSGKQYKPVQMKNIRRGIRTKHFIA